MTVGGGRDAQTGYLARLAATLKVGLGGLDAAAASRHAAAVLGFRRSSGGFAGRRGAPNLYYTAFAARVLNALGKLENEVAQGILCFLRGRQPANAIDALNLLEASLLVGGKRPEAAGVAAVLEALRAPGGGYAKAPEAEEGSTYHTFLAALCYELLGTTCPDLEGIRRFVSSRLRPDGGFSETAAAASSATNATAAGVALAQIVGLADAGCGRRATEFLLAMRQASGGWLALPGAPLPDLMSTFTALVSLKTLGALDAAVRKAAASFAAACERANGGFGAGPWDTGADVEYTYYGLGVLALAHPAMPGTAFPLDE